MLIFIAMAGLALPFCCHSRYSSPLFSFSFFFFFNDVTEFHRPSLVSGAVAEVENEQKPHRARKHFGIMDAERIFCKDALDIFVCQGYPGIWFVSFSMLPEFTAI